MYMFFQSKPPSPSISVREAYERVAAQKGVLIDVRTPEEFADERPVLAQLITLSEFPTHAEALKVHDEIYIICRSGARSATAVDFLHSQGITNSLNVEGGIIAWKGEGLPTER